MGNLCLDDEDKTFAVNLSAAARNWVYLRGQKKGHNSSMGTLVTTASGAIEDLGEHIATIGLAIVGVAAVIGLVRLIKGMVKGAH